MGITIYYRSVSPAVYIYSPSQAITISILFEKQKQKPKPVLKIIKIYIKQFKSNQIMSVILPDDYNFSLGDSWLENFLFIENITK